MIGFIENGFCVRLRFELFFEEEIIVTWFTFSRFDENVRRVFIYNDLDGNISCLGVGLEG